MRGEAHRDRQTAEPSRPVACRSRSASARSIHETRLERISRLRRSASYSARPTPDPLPEGVESLPYYADMNYVPALLRFASFEVMHAITRHMTVANRRGLPVALPGNTRPHPQAQVQSSGTPSASRIIRSAARRRISWAIAISSRARCLRSRSRWRRRSFRSHDGSMSRSCGTGSPRDWTEANSSRISLWTALNAPSHTPLPQPAAHRPPQRRAPEAHPSPAGSARSPCARAPSEAPRHPAGLPQPSLPFASDAR